MYQMINRSRRKLRLGWLHNKLKKLNWDKKFFGKTIDVVFTTDGEIASLNRRFLKKSNPTDVLSFNLSDDQDDIFGEIIISVDTAMHQAKENNVPLYQELLLLSIHGLLHLLGEKDDTMAATKRMRRLEERAMRRVTRNM